MNKKIVVISGLTASGKSALAIEIAKNINGVILNADSMQIYKGLPILSAQPNVKDLSLIEHRLYNYLEPYESNSVFKWLQLIKTNIDDVLLNEKIPVIVGGTGMYISRFINGIKYLPDTNLELRNELNKLYENIGWDRFYNMVEEIDKESLNNIKKNDKHKLIRIYEIYKTSGKTLSYFEKLENEKLFERDKILHINIIPNKEDVYKSCNKRFQIMLDDLNVINEVKTFINNNDNIFNSNSSILHTVGLLEIRDFINKKIDYDKMFESATKNTRNYAKRQFTWFKNQFKSVDFFINILINKDNIKQITEEVLTLYDKNL